MKAKRSIISKETQSRPEVKAKKSIAAKNHTHDPSKSPWLKTEYREKMSAAIKTAINRPEVKARRLVAQKTTMTKEFREKMSNISKINSMRPNVKANMRFASKITNSRIDVRNKISNKLRKITDEQVLLIKEFHLNGKTQRFIASKLHISKTSVCLILKGKRHYVVNAS